MCRHLVQMWTFLGITAHFFSHKDTESALTVRKMTGSHTAENIREVVEDEWELPECKVKEIVTENGSNIMAAFMGYLYHEDDWENDTVEESTETDCDSRKTKDLDHDLQACSVSCTLYSY